MTTRRALCLAGGGVLGAAYEIGALTAVEDRLPDRDGRTEWDIFVGVSAGALVASFLAQGVAARTLYDYFSHSDLAPSIFGLRKSRIRRFERGLREVFDAMRLSNSFSDLRKPLFISAIDVDDSEEVIFGTEGTETATITEAVAASCAIPPVFGPMTIGSRRFVDGALGSPLRLDIATEAGATHVLAVDPIAPQRPPLACRTLDAILTQCQRIEHASRAALALAYAALATPDVKVLVLRPRRRDMYVQGSMEWRATSRLMRLGYDLTARRLEQDDAAEFFRTAPRSLAFSQPTRAAI